MDNEVKLKRLNNIIVYNIEENKADIASDRNVDDMQFSALLWNKFWELDVRRVILLK